MPQFCFLYTDIEGSTSLWDSDPEGMRSFVDRHDSLVQSCVANHSGTVFKSLGDGLAARFETSRDAVVAGAALQRKLCEETFARVRIGVDLGEVDPTTFDLQGPVLNRIARITQCGWGGQVLLGHRVWMDCKEDLPPELGAIDLGEYLLRGLSQAERIWQLTGPGLESHFPPLQGFFRPPPNIPQLERPFVGRTTERKAIRQLLDSEGVRLLTILGFGGMGKTTLAQVVAEEIAESGANVSWVSCEGILSGDQLVSELALARRLTLESSCDLASLCEQLGNEEILFVLDCFERLLTAKDVVDQVLRACKGIKFLVTSRALLGSGFESEFALKPMVQTRRGKPDFSDAVALYETCAQRIRPDFAAHGKVRTLVREIVSVVEGIPLAILLVAGRERHFATAEILSQVRESVLGTAQNVLDHTGRHANLRRVIESSLSLISEEDQIVLRELQVFWGGFDLAAAKAVLENQTLPEILSRLRDYSLLTADVSSGTARFKMLDSIREYLEEDMAEPALGQLRRRHAAYFGENPAGNSVIQDHQNFRAASLFAAEVRDEGLGLKLAKLTLRPWLEAGYLTDFERYAKFATYSAAGSTFEPELLGLRAMSAKRHGDLDSADALLAEKQRLCFQAGDIAGTADALGDRLGLVLASGTTNRLAPLLTVYDTLEWEAPESEKLAHKVLRARCASALGERAIVDQLINEILGELSSAAGTEFEVFILDSLLSLMRDVGRNASAGSLALRMIEVSLRQRYAQGCAQALLHLSRAANSEGDIEKAIECAQMAWFVSVSRSQPVHLEAKRALGLLRANPNPSLRGSWVKNVENLIKNRQL